MTGSSLLPSIEALKDQAKRLRAKLNATGASLGYNQALELLAHQHGFKDWNTLHANVGNRAPVCPVMLGQRVKGHYLGQEFEAEILGVRASPETGRFRISLHFDEPVDVVTFDSFSAFRQRVFCSIGADGVTLEKTSNGQPQLRLHL